MIAPVDVIYARRERTRAMLRRAKLRLLRGARLRVPVVDREAIVGLKLQAMVNAPRRRSLDEADIRALLAEGGATLDVGLLRDYYRVFDRERDLDRLLAETRKK